MNLAHPASRRAVWLLAAVAIVAVLAAHAFAAAPSSAAPLPTTTAPPGDASRITLWSTLAAGGIIGYLIILMSLVSVALVVEHFITIRQSRLVPPELVDALDAHLGESAYEAAQQTCLHDGSFLAQVVGAGLNQIGAVFGFFDMQNAMQEVSERHVSKLYRKLEYLSFIAASASMMGLLGTVTGMIRSFNKIAATEGAAKPSELAGGISEALVTTCLGLAVAIPTIFFVAFFRNRIDSIVAEAEVAVEKLMGRFRRSPTP